MFKRIWNDPVWSKVIAAIFTGIPTCFMALSTSAQAFMQTPSLPNWIVLILVISLLIGMYLLYKKRAQDLKSDEWFAEIATRLKDCGYARIYLRGFEHPDNFKESHRQALMQIIGAIKTMIQNGVDLKIIAFHPDGGKSGVDWLKSELKVEDISASIKISKKQPVANASSMYLFDNKQMIFNRINDKKTTYHVENYSNSIVHELIKLGFDDFMEKAK